MGTRKVTFRVPVIQAGLWMKSKRMMLLAVTDVPAVYSSHSPNFNPNRNLILNLTDNLNGVR